MPLMFERQARESDKAFAAFRTYLELGPQRSLVAVATKLDKCVTLIERWSRKFEWPARVQAHAEHLANVEREAAEALAVQKGVDWAKREERQREEEWQNRGELIALARAAIERWKKNPVRCGTLEGIARILELASKLGRLATGMGTDGARRKGDDMLAVRVEVTLALEKIYGEPLPGEVAEPAAIVDVEEVASGRCQVAQTGDAGSQTGNPGSQTGKWLAQTGEIEP